MTNLSKTPAQIIFDEISLANPDTQVTISDYTLGVPNVETGAKNTSIVATAADGSPYVGTQTFFYDRVDLNAPGAYVNSLGPIPKTAEMVTLQDVLNYFNDAAGTAIAPADITATAFPVFENVPDEEHTITLTAQATSLIWLGSVTLTLKLLKVDLATVLPNNTLNGLTYVPPTP